MMKSLFPCAEVLLILSLFVGIVAVDTALHLFDALVCRGVSWHRATETLHFDDRPLILAGHKGQRVLLARIDITSAEVMEFGER